MLFSSIIFSGIFTKNIDSQAIRYITPYVHRVKIYFAKYLAMISYFTLVLLVSLIIIFIVVILLSIVCFKERMASFVGVFISLFFPAIGAWAML